MKQLKIPAAFMRGGTSKAVIFKATDLPTDRALWPEIFRAALGSPDPFGRQLNGLGGGISSLSKVCVVAPSSRADADVDYTYASIGVKNDTVSIEGNCGNMSSAIGPFAVDEGLIEVRGPKAVVRIHNTNTGKIMVAHFDLDDGAAAVDGDYLMPGVADPGSRVRLDFLDPGGAKTGKLLPTGNPVDRLDVPGLGQIDVTIVDAANVAVFVNAAVVGLQGTELPAEIDARADILQKLEAIRCHAGVLAGLASTPEKIGSMATAIQTGIVARAQDAVTLTGKTLNAADGDLSARIVSSGNVHRAMPVTRSICTAVASRIEGTVVHRVTRPPQSTESDIRILHPSGVMVVAADVAKVDGLWHAAAGTVFRNQRRLFEGNLCIPAAKLPNYAKWRAEQAEAHSPAP
jgi:2-methylaconitate cis-trans-isomerase PrpF